MPRRLIDVPSAVAQVAQAALQARAMRQAGGTARGVVIATALASGHATYSELAEAREWHRKNREEIREGRSSLLGGLYGGAPGRSWVSAVEGAVAAARNPEGVGAMIALPVPDDVVKVLARDDGEPPSAFHLTLFHLGNDAADLDASLRPRYADALAHVAEMTETPVITLTHVERFSPTDEGLEPVVVVSDDPDAYALREAVETVLVSEGLAFANDHAFRAHVTIGYYPPGDGPDSGPLPEPLALTPDALELWWGPQVDRHPFPVSQTETAAAPGHYVLADGIPVDGPFPDRAAARAALEPGDDGIVYLDGTPLAHTAAPEARVRRRRQARLRRFVADVQRIDRNLARRVHAAAEAAFREAVRRAQVNLRQKARTGAQKDALVASRGLATPALLAALGLEESRLVTHSFDEVGDLFREWAAQAERDKLVAAAKHFTPDPDLGDEDREWSETMLEGQFGAEVDRRSELAAGLLVAGLGRLALGRLSRGAGEVRGEQRGAVPFGVIRDPLDVVRTGTPGRGESLADRIVRDREPDARASGGMWVHGYYGEPDQPFDPHLDLDGVGGPDDPDGPLTGDDDPRLANPESFPDGDYYYEGDHLGDTCAILWGYEIAEPAADVEVTEPEAVAAVLASAQSPTPNQSPAMERVLARVAGVQFSTG